MQVLLVISALSFAEKAGNGEENMMGKSLRMKGGKRETRIFLVRCCVSSGLRGINIRSALSYQMWSLMHFMAAAKSL